MRTVTSLSLPLLLMLLFVSAVRATAADESSQARGEIEALIAGLSGSDCRFQRNGSWHDGARAASHLRRKYRVYLRRSQRPQAEEFITAVASHSSITGRPYRVRCEGQPESDAGEWFTRRLQQQRGGTPR